MTTYLKTLLLYFLWLCAFNYALGQQNVLKTIPVNHYETSRALKKFLFIDHQGFYWYSAYNGLIKETGYSTLKIPFNHPSKRIVVVSEIIQTKANTLVAATDGGIFRLDLNTGEKEWLFYNLQEANATILSDFSSVLEDAKGNLWFCTTNRKIIKYNGTTLEYFDFKNKPRYAPIFVKELETNKIVIRANNDWYLLSNGQIEPLLNTNTINTLDNPNKTSAFAENGLVFPKNKNGSYTFKNKKYNYYYVSEIDQQIFELPFRVLQLSPNNPRYHKYQKDLWFQENKHFNQYVFKTNNTTIELVVNKTIAVTEPIWYYKVLKEKLTTIGPDYINIYNLKDNTFFNTTLNPENNISSRGFYKNKKGILYVNTEPGFHYRTAKENKLKVLETKISLDIKNNLISYNFIAVNDSLFLCYGRSYQLIALEPFKKEHYLLPKDSIYPTSSRDVVDMIRLDKEHVLMANVDDLYVYNITTTKTKKYSPYLSYTLFKGLHLTDIFFNKKTGALFVGTEANGLYYITKDNTIYNFNTSSTRYPIVSNYVEYIMQSTDGHLWVGTRKGLQRIALKTLKSTTIYGKSKLLKNRHVVGILEDTGQNNLWISTYNGLLVYNQEDEMTSVFFEKDGVANDEFNRKSFFKENDSTFYFGGIKGITTFNPKKFKRKQNETKLLLSQLNITNTAKNTGDTLYFGLDSLKALKLPNQDYTAKLLFSINDLAYAEQTQYQYKIEEIDNSWLNFDYKNALLIKGFKPGNYTLSIQSFDTEGVATQKLQYALVIGNYYYQTLLFKLVSALLVLLVLGGLYYMRKKRRTNILKQKNEINLLKAKYLQESMNPHFISNSLNNIQSVMFTKGELVANKYINDFSKILRKTLDMNGIEKISLYHEIEYLKSYINIKTVGLNLNIKTTIHSAEDLNMQDTIIPCMLLQPIVENAIIHGLAQKKENPELKLMFSNPKKNCLEISIEDNGVGRDYRGVTTKTNTSWSLKILEERLLIYNSLKSNYIKMNTVDLKKEGKTLGTKVTIVINDSFN